MAVRYYDDAIVDKLLKWIPESSNLRILKPDESKRFFETKADDSNDKPLLLPVISLSRNPDIRLLSNVKQPRSYDGLSLIKAQSDLSNLHGEAYTTALEKIPDGTLRFNIIPIQVQYQLDIYTKTAEEGDEYLRNFLFKLINNPAIVIDIPYNSKNIATIDPTAYLRHIANIRVLDTISDTSSIPERLFNGQFTRWTMQLELQDAFLFSIPYKKNWRINVDDICGCCDIKCKN